MGSVGDITEVERVIISKIDKPRMQLFVLSKDKTFACTQRISFDSEIDFNMYFIKVGKIRKQQLKNTALNTKRSYFNMNQVRNEIQIILDKVLTLGKGKLVLPFKTKGEMLSKKTLLHNEKKKYMESVPDAKSIYISQDSKNLTLTLSTSPTAISWINDIQVIDEKGNVESLCIPELNDQIQEISMDAEILRITKLMREDGCSEEDIALTIKDMQEAEETKRAL